MKSAAETAFECVKIDINAIVDCRQTIEFRSYEKAY